MEAGMESPAVKTRHELLKIFGIGVLVGGISFAWSIILNGGLFSLAGDFNAQQIPFAMAGNDAIKAGQWGWAWFLDLGSGFIGGQSFYTLGNPSFWISLLFPSSWFMYVVGWLYALKYAVATLTAYMYIRQYVKNFRTASIGALLYAFSGFMATNLLFYHFHDVVALFPLMLVTLDGIMLRKRKGLFIFAVFINAVVNYYFIIGEIIFLAAYYIIRYLVPDFRANIKKLLQILFEGALGCLLGAALLVPSFLFTIQNPRVTVDYTGSNSGVFTFERYLYILKGLLFPGEVMSHQCAVIRTNFSSCNAYLPMVGLVLVIAFLSLHKKHWVSRMLKFSLVMAVVPFFNASFSLFAGLYCRWYYMPLLIMALASAIVLERWDVERKTADHRAYMAIRRAEELRLQKEAEELANGPATIAEAARLAELSANANGSLPGNESTAEGRKQRQAYSPEDPRFRMVRASVPDPEGKPKRKPTESERAITKGFIIWGLILLGFTAFLVFVPWKESEPSKIYSWWQYTIWASVSGLGTLLTWLILTKKRKKRLRTMAIAVMFFCVLTTGGVVLSYQIVHGEGARKVYDRLMTSAKIDYTTPEYRFQGRDNLETLAHGYPASGNFCSTVAGSIFRFYEGLGLSRDVKSPDAPDGLYTLISARYSTARKPAEDQEPIQVVYGDNVTYYVYEDETIPPIGFTQDTYMTLSEFKQTNTATRCIRMLRTLIVADEDEEKVSGILRHYDDDVDGVPAKWQIEDAGTAHLEESSRDVERDSWHYASTITTSQDKYAFFSIPNDDGWSCTVNGEAVEILDSNGFMAVPLKAGENRVVFHYEIPGLKMGIYMSLGAVLVTVLYFFIVFCYWFFKGRKKDAMTGWVPEGELAVHGDFSGEEPKKIKAENVEETASGDSTGKAFEASASSPAGMLEDVVWPFAKGKMEDEDGTAPKA